MTDYTDAQRISWLAEQFKTCTVYMSGQHPYHPNSLKLRNLRGPTFRAALDAAMKENGWEPAAAPAPSAPADQKDRCPACGGSRYVTAWGKACADCGGAGVGAPADQPSPDKQGQQGEKRPLNGIAATDHHGEGAIARCSYCGRYSLDRKTLGEDRYQPVCECGEKHGWSGSFVKPGPDARWSGASPAPTEEPRTDGREDCKP